MLISLRFRTRAIQTLFAQYDVMLISVGRYRGLVSKEDYWISCLICRKDRSRIAPPLLDLLWYDDQTPLSQAGRNTRGVHAKLDSVGQLYSTISWLDNLSQE